MFPYTRYFILIVTAVFLAFSLPVTALPSTDRNPVDLDYPKDVGTPYIQFSFIGNIGEDPGSVLSPIDKWLKAWSR
jgi:hypothetical protein